MARQLIRIIVLITLLKLSCANKIPPGSGFDSRRWKCVPVKIKFCQQLHNYNNTIDMRITRPNPFTGLETQEESHTFISQFDQLVKTGCSRYLKILICSVFLPLCDNTYPEPITACRNLCLEVKNKCFKYFQKHDSKWPDKLNCARFPKDNTEGSMCLDGGLGEVKTTKKPKRTSKISKRTPKTKSTMLMPYLNYTVTKSIRCSSIYARNPNSYVYSHKYQACALGCIKDGLFTLDDKKIASKWIVLLTSLCLTLNVFALLLILLDSSSFLYYERPIIFVVLSYFCYSIAYLIRIVKTREEVTCFTEDSKKYVLIDGSANALCTTIFLLTYCFFMAQNIWWVFLCLTWFLNIACQINEATLKRNFKYFHIMAWGIPCSIAIAVLVLRKIDVDELTGMCFTGSHYNNLSTLREFVIAPLFTFLVMGVIFLCSAFIGLYKRINYSNHKPNKNQTEITIQPGFHAVSHTFFLTYILSSYFYEYDNKTAWYENPVVEGANFYIFLLRLIMIFFNGIIASLLTISKILPALYTRIYEKLFLTKSHRNSMEESIVISYQEKGGKSETSI